ncbi:hypothetical protein PV749_27995 [Streptomyces sp. ID03-2B]|uniref:Peptidoglycan binding domain-containing protein n=1 Tax=Streptomyces caviscabies TaxID=90079 RepID=A0ABW2M7T9_9ACTN|nr:MULTISPECIES: hypothetical protein [Streptomyces]MDX3594973.1 hypothetical protein [Streptomyces sp. ID03-2B]MDX5519648.1 hypothetical protein [Streptomyces sp. DE06-01C]
MSRETDSSSSGPQGRGGAAYPSGTPPYGSRQYPSPHPSQDGSDENPESVDPPRPEEPKTETTLTTRIRINIPGSRPIPPVVMRTPMAESDIAGGRSDTERTGATPRPGTPPSAPAAGVGGGSGPSVRSAAGPDGGAPADRSRDGGPAADPTPAEKPAREKSGSDWFAPRKAPAGGAGAAAQGAGASGGPGGAPSGPGGPGSAPGTGGPGGPGAGGLGGPGAGNPTGPGGDAGRSRPDLPYFSDAPQPGGAPGGPGRSALDAFGADAPGPGARTPGPSGPTTGPVTGTSSLTPNLDGVPGLGGPGPMVPGVPGGVPPRMSDDTAILTPQAPAPEPGPGGHVSGSTLTSGIPVVPSEPRTPFPGGPGTPGGPPAGGPGGPGGPGVPAPGPAAPRPAQQSAAAPAPAKKGRSKLVLLGVAAVVLLGIAYGAGLLLNHAEVPKGTTVLGVDIGGGTKEEAVAKLDAALGERAKKPLQLSVDGKEEQLDPAKAGLTLDSQETVRGAAGSDYNPVSVIGSLFGGERPADPVIPVDEEKLGVALTDLAGASGSASDGTIRFEPNKAVAVPGKPGKTLDAGQSLISVRDAYRAQVQTGQERLVELPVTTSEPTITKAELDRAMREFAEPAMSGLITIKAGPKQIQFGPARSLPQILSMKAVDGRLVDVYDKKAIDTLLDGVFDGIMAVKGDGKEHQVGPDDVAQAMKTALAGKTPAERTVTIDLTGQG